LGSSLEMNWEAFCAYLVTSLIFHSGNFCDGVEGPDLVLASLSCHAVITPRDKLDPHFVSLEIGERSRVF
jgi:hypothetical protein